MLPHFLIIFAIFLCQFVDCDNINKNEVIIPELGTIIGTTTTTTWKNEKIYQFRGIPYAEPPINELRFKVRNKNILSYMLPRV